MTYGHLQADCLYTGISSGPNGIEYMKPLPLPFYVDGVIKFQTVSQLLAVALLIELPCHCMCVCVCVFMRPVGCALYVSTVVDAAAN